MKQNNLRHIVKRKFFLETILVFFIAVTPFLYKLYDFIPAEELSYEFLGLTVDSHGFADVSTYVWFLAGKVIPLSLLLIWFLTSKNWWYHIILIPLAMYAFQIFEVLYTYDNNIDTENILWLLPICMVIIPFVYFIRVKLYDKHVHGIDLEAMDAELEALKTKKDTRETKISSEDLDNIKQESLADELDRKLSTHKIEQAAKQFQSRLQNLVNFNNK